MMSETTTPLLIQLDAEERAALRQAQAGHPRPYSEAQMARLLLRDALIGLGDLKMLRANRGRAAGDLLKRKKGPPPRR